MHTLEIVGFVLLAAFWPLLVPQIGVTFFDGLMEIVTWQFQLLCLAVLVRYYRLTGRTK
jgi:hypothetical protein